MAKKQSELEKNIRYVGEKFGELKAIKYNQAVNDLYRYDTFSQVKEHKGYRKIGMTWEQFCILAGENVRTVDRLLLTERSLLVSEVERAVKKILSIKVDQTGGDND